MILYGNMGKYNSFGNFYSKPNSNFERLLNFFHFLKSIFLHFEGGYAEALCVQQNRKGEGDKLKSWSESAWRNHRLSLSEALDWSDSTPKLPIIDSRISRVL